MKYFLEEITTLKDGATAVAIAEKASKDIAISTLHQARMRMWLESTLK